MDEDFENFQMSDFIDNTGWNVHRLNMVLGPIWDSLVINHGKITPKVANHWVWFPKTNSKKISAFVNYFLNNYQADTYQWDGCKNVWRLNVAPKTKTFIWILLQNKVKTYDYLYHMNLGPHDPCILCGLVVETSNHLLRLCAKSQYVWNIVQE